MTTGWVEWLLLLIALLIGGLAWKVGAPVWAALILSLAMALLIRRMREQGRIELLVRWLHRHEEPSGP
ncbi:hypothetical protein [Micromonospora rubida]|uniref:hypothetical protein n=1 Tax=Micromonospora rubida TaxID=2697657 RepID=UPI00137771DB|nr:hypothetical protein [Micromonospora rubida]NBE79627.1 hypothetical protein [Micromonospora rubida]